MFRWYQEATICYAYLVDVTNTDELGNSKWFTRGWTLQELIASKVVQFYSADWRDLGSKQDLQDELEKITGIEKFVLLTCDFEQVCVAKRMSWAANRKTTRVEDMAYSLMGIFGVNMPLLYGEGTRSFIRLQEEIMKVSDDHTLFAWGLPLEFSHMDQSAMQSWSKDAHGPGSSPYSQLRGLLANSPSEFATKHDLRSLRVLQSDMPPIMSSNGVRIELPVWIQTKLSCQFAAISCYVHAYNTKFLGIPLSRWGESFTARSGPLVLLSEADWPTRARETLLIKQPPASIPSPPDPSTFKIMRTSQQKEDYFTIDEIYCLGGASYSQNTQTITFPINQRGPHAILFFQPRANFTDILSAKYRELTSDGTKQSISDREYGLRKVSGYSFLSPFAIVLGSDTEHWAAFLPILDEATAEKDFHKLLREREHWVQYCATKTQLKLYLDDRNQEGVNLDKRCHLDKRLLRTRALWFYKDGRSDTQYSCFLDMDLCLKLMVRPANFTETAVFVCIDITVRMEKHTLQKLVEELHQAHFTGVWWENMELKWFPGVPKTSTDATSHADAGVTISRS